MSDQIEGRVVVLAGGLSPERDVSIRSGRRVAEALRDTGVEVSLLDVDAGLLPALASDPPAAVIPVLHGAAGEDGAVRDVLAALRLPFVGSTAAACRRTFDKSIAGPLLAAAGIEVPRAAALPHAAFREMGATAVLDAVVDAVGLPLVVKPTKGGSALGVSVVHDAAELPAAMVGAFAYGDTVMLEQYVAGTEIAVAVLDDGTAVRALPAVEIVPDGGLYDYPSRYTAGATEFFVPARLEDDVAARAAAVAVAAHQQLGLRDWTRADIIVAADGSAVLLEVCVAPGFTETSLYPQALAAAGLGLGPVAAGLAATAVGRGPDR